MNWLFPSEGSSQLLSVFLDSGPHASLFDTGDPVNPVALLPNAADTVRLFMQLETSLKYSSLTGEHNMSTAEDVTRWIVAAAKATADKVAEKLDERLGAIKHEVDKFSSTATRCLNGVEQTANEALAPRRPRVSC